MTLLTPLESWIASKIGLPPEVRLHRAALEAYQLRKLRDTFDHATRQSPFYRRHLADCAPPATLRDLSALPFTTPAHIRDDDRRFICVSQGEIERAVTLYSSGTTSPSKRLHFTAGDLELTVDFFHHGMGTMVAPGQKVLILMPGELPGSVGDLLAKGLARLGVEGIIHGLVRDYEATLADIERLEVDCLVGLPVQLLGLARHPSANRLTPNRIKSILTSADYAPLAVIRALEETWGAPVFDHYGMTEMGLGGAVECAARCGYHPREADLLFEIIDPRTGVSLPDGETGEVVFTTLTRRGMPLIRYRTGDMARFLPAPCPCGSVLRRLERVQGRMAGTVRLAGNLSLNITDLDEALFPLPFLRNYQALLSRRDGRDTLSTIIESDGTSPEVYTTLLHEAILSVPAISEAMVSGVLTLEPPGSGAWIPSPTIKRSIIDRREEAQ